MSLALSPLRAARVYFLPFFRRPALFGALAWSAALQVSHSRLALPSLQSLLDLLPPFLLAVPKKKVSHSRKAMRSANKGLKDKTNIVNCPGCGSPKLAHHLCSNCFSQISREFKREERQKDSNSS